MIYTLSLMEHFFFLCKLVIFEEKKNSDSLLHIYQQIQITQLIITNDNDS